MNLQPILLDSSTTTASEEVSETVETVEDNLSSTFSEVMDTLGISVNGSNLSLSNLISALVILIVCIIAIKLIMRMTNRILKNSKLDKTLHSFIRSGVRIICWVLTAIIVVGSMGFDVSSLIAVLSVAGLAVSLALENTLSNVASGIMLLATKPFVLGDWIECGDQSGTVEEISLAYTKILTIDDKLISIPNSTVAGANIINYSTKGFRKVVQTYNVAYENDMEKVKRALRTAIDNCDMAITDKEHEPFIHIYSYGESTITFVIRVWCKNDDYWNMHYFLLEEVGRVFREQGILFSYNRMNVEMVNSDGSQLNVALSSRKQESCQADSSDFSTFDQTSV